MGDQQVTSPCLDKSIQAQPKQGASLGQCCDYTAKQLVAKSRSALDTILHTFTSCSRPTLQFFPYKYKCPDLPILINFQGRNWRNNVASSRQAVLVGSWSFYCRSHLIWEKYVSANHLIAVTQMSARQWWEPISAATTCWRDCDPHQVHRTHDFWHPASVWCNEALNNGMLVAFVACLLQTIENVWS